MSVKMSPENVWWVCVSYEHLCRSAIILNFLMVDLFTCHSVKGTVHHKINLAYLLPLLLFIRLSCRDICLLSNIMEKDGAQLVVLRVTR